MLAAIITGTAPTDWSTNYVDQTAASNAAQVIVNATTAQPALTRADIVRLAGVAGGQIGGTTEQKETIPGAPSELCQTLT